MGKIPRSEATVDFRPQPQPFSSGDGYEMPGKGLQRIGQGIAAVGDAFASFQGVADKDDLHNTKINLLNASHDQDLEDRARMANFNPDTDNIDTYAPERVGSFEARMRSVIQSAGSQHSKQLAELQAARMRGSVGERAYGFAEQQKQQKLYLETERTLTREFGGLSQELPPYGPLPSPDTENQVGGFYGEVGVAPASPMPVDPRQAYQQRLERTLQAGEAIIRSYPGGSDRKQRLAEHVAGLAFSALSTDDKKLLYPTIEGWMKSLNAPGGVQGADAQSSSMQGGSPMAVARQYLGAHERNPGDSKVLSEFFAKSGGQKLSPADTAWCAAFVNAALGASGQKGTGTLLARDFLKFGTETKTPNEGDIVVLSRGNSSWQGHVGFYAGRDANGNVRILGGNQGDQVSIKSFPASQVLGYRKPPSAGTEIPGIQVASVPGATATDTRTASATDSTSIKGTITAYSPQAGGSRMEGGYAAAKPGPDGKAEVRTLDDYASGRAPYITVVGNPSLNGKAYVIPRIEYQDASGNTQTLTNVRAVVHDTGSAFKNAPEGRFDIPVARDADNGQMAANHARWRKAGVEFIPEGSAGANLPGRIPVGESSPVRTALMEKLLRAGPAMKERYIKQVDGMVSAIESHATRSYEMPDAVIDKVAEEVTRTGDPNLAQRMELLSTAVRNARAARAAAPADLKAAIQEIEAEAARGPISPIRIATLDFLKKQDAETVAALAKQPYDLGVRAALLPPVTPLRPDMPPEALQVALAQRVADKALMEARMKQAVPLFQSGEGEAFKDWFTRFQTEKTNPNAPDPIEARLAVLRVMYDGLGDQFLPVSKTLFAQEAPGIAMVAWLVAKNGDPQTIKTMMRGIGLSKADGFVSRAASETSFASAVDRITRGAFSVEQRNEQYVREAARFYYEAKAADKKIDPTQKGVDPDLVKEAVQAVTGLNVVNGIRYGGIEEAGANFIRSGEQTIVVPSVRHDGGLRSIQSALRTTDLMAINPYRGATGPDMALASAAAAGRDQPGSGKVMPTGNEVFDTGTAQNAPEMERFPEVGAQSAPSSIEYAGANGKKTKIAVLTGMPVCESRSDTASQKRLNCSVALPEQKYGR